MIRDEAPRITGGSRFGKKGREPLDQVVPVDVVTEHVPSLDPSDHHVMENTS